MSRSQNPCCFELHKHRHGCPAYFASENEFHSAKWHGMHRDHNGCSQKRPERNGVTSMHLRMCGMATRSSGLKHLAFALRERWGDVESLELRMWKTVSFPHWLRWLFPWLPGDVFPGNRLDQRTCTCFLTHGMQLRNTHKAFRCYLRGRRSSHSQSCRFRWESMDVLR
jgi:hypothetical protein